VARRPGVAVALVGVLLVISGHFAGFTYVRPVLEQVTHLDVASDFADAAGVRRRRLLRQFRRRFLAERDPRLAVLGGAGPAGRLGPGHRDPGRSAGGRRRPAVWGFAFAMLPVGFQAWVTSEAPTRPNWPAGC
jgi:hypothetical protein